MRLCFVADFRSPIAQNWISHFAAAGHQVHVISTYPVDPGLLPVASLHVVPVAFSFLLDSGSAHAAKPASPAPVSFARLDRLRAGSLGRLIIEARHWLGPFDLLRYVGEVRRLVDTIRPDLVHAMRIPFEGLLAAAALQESTVPLVVSIWGNDFTRFAPRYPHIGLLTRRLLRMTAAVHADCRRDIDLAYHWGFCPDRPALVVPGAGGIDLSVFHSGPADPALMQRWSIAPEVPVVFYPRRFRPGAVRTDTLFRAIPRVWQRRPAAVFAGVGMAGHALAESWRRQLPDPAAVRLLPTATKAEMAELFRRAEVTVSPSQHDGTPNTVLEAMASGSFPVVGDIASLREWVTDGVNGLLCDPTCPESLAQAILRALDDDELRRQAARRNLDIVHERAEYRTIMARVEGFYQDIIRPA